MAGTIVHLGVSKAASTALQTHVFPNHSGIFYLGKNLSSREPDHFYRGDASRFLTQSLISLDRYSGIPAQIKSSVAEYRRQADGRPLVFSNEHFCESTCPLMQAQILREVFGIETKLLLVIRNQFDAILSQYGFVGSAVRHAPAPYYGKSVKFDSYFDYLLHNHRNAGGHKARDWIGDYLRILDYNTFLEINAQVFGQERIIVVAFEQLVKDFSVVFQKIGVDSIPIAVPKTNASMRLSRRGTQALAFIERLPGNHLMRSFVRTVASPLHRRIAYGGVPVELSDQQREIVRGIFGPGNAKLAECFGLDLAALGYPL